MSALDAARMIDELFERAVLHPGDLDEPALVGFMQEAAEAIHHDKAMAKPLRRSVTVARKLAAYWQEREPGALPDWHNGVDEVYGTRGWQPQLDLVRTALGIEPSAEVFAAVKERHRAVHFTPWMEDVSFEDWLADESGQSV